MAVLDRWAQREMVRVTPSMKATANFWVVLALFLVQTG